MNDVYRTLRDDILSSALPPGTLLSENGMAARFGISRTPVREALQRLVNEQLAERGPHGVAVKESSPEEILDIYEVRTTLEGLAARAAAARHTALDLAKLRRAQGEMVETTPTDSRAMATANRAFHETLWAASHNPTLTDVLERLNAHLIRYPTTTLTHGDRWARVLFEHEQMIDAIARRDAEGAERLSIDHMTKARDIRLEMYSQG